MTYMAALDENRPVASAKDRSRTGELDGGSGCVAVCLLHFAGCQVMPNESIDPIQSPSLFKPFLIAVVVHIIQVPRTSWVQMRSLQHHTERLIEVAPNLQGQYRSIAPKATLDV